MKRLSLILISLLIILVLVTPFKKFNNAEAILKDVPNFSFEQVDSAGNILSWNKFSTNTIMKSNTEIFHSGKRSLEIVDNSNTASAGAISNSFNLMLLLVKLKRYL